MSEKRGRKSLLTDDRIKIVMIMAKLGATDKEMAAEVGVTEQTINNWKKANPTFFESLKSAKKIADEKVQKALFRRATGYSHKEDKIFVHNGEPVIVPTTKHYPPDTMACIYWMNNRDSENWKNRQETKITMPSTDGDKELLEKLLDDQS